MAFLRTNANTNTNTNANTNAVANANTNTNTHASSVAMTSDDPVERPTASHIRACFLSFARARARARAHTHTHTLAFRGRIHARSLVGHFALAKWVHGCECMWIGYQGTLNQDYD